MNKKLSYAILALVVILAFTFAAPSSANADWKIKNNCMQTVYVAIAYYDGDTWVSEGWYQVNPRKTTTVLSGDLPQTYYYLYAVSYDGDHEWDGDYWFLVDEDDSFYYTNADRGTDRYQSKGFMQCVSTGDDMTTTLSID